MNDPTTPAAAPAATLSDDDLKDLAHSAYEEAMSFGLSLDVFMRYFKTLRNRAAAPAPQGDDAQDAAPAMTESPRPAAPAPSDERAALVELVELMRLREDVSYTAWDKEWNAAWDRARAIAASGVSAPNDKENKE